jgi:hypothetical protein
MNTATTSCFTATSVHDIDDIISIFPNPTTDYLTINYEGEKEIYNMLGVKIMITNNNEIDVRDLASGVYIVRLEEENLRFIKK